MKFLFAILAAFFVYLSIASVVFSIRNPWMTEVEQMLNIDKILKFEKVDKKEFEKQYQ
jgi:hypothetical protein